MRGILVGLMALAAAGCGTPHPADSGRLPLDRNEFADIYVELRRAAIASDSAPDFAARQLEILERYGISGPELIDYVERNSNDLKGLAATWDSIYKRLGRIDSAGQD